MTDKKLTPEQTLLALKYPGYRSWRDLESAINRGGYWPSGEPVRLSDPEMRPRMDDLMDDFRNDRAKALLFMQNLGLHKSTESK